MNFFDNYFFGYLPQNFKNVIRGVCLIVVAILLWELALTFIIVVVLIGIISRILMRFFNLFSH